LAAHNGTIKISYLVSVHCLTGKIKAHIEILSLEATVRLENGFDYLAMQDMKCKGYRLHQRKMSLETKCRIKANARTRAVNVKNNSKV
jgi:hypothetical protein